ncbi:MAG: COX15/CtaA family protein [Ignavibacteria bacterium]|jgi:cytochrome c oxidase assembly protein subunit 15
MLQTSQDNNAHKTIHRIALVLCVLTFALIVWGGHVNTTRSGMAFPDWPTSNLAPMVTYTPSEWLWAKDKFWEHGHRLFASLVGLVTTVLLLLAYRATPKSDRPNKALMGVVGVVFATIVTAIFGMNAMPVGIMETFMIGLGILMLGFIIRSAKASHEQRLVWLAMSAFVAVCLQGSFGGYTVRNNLPDWTSTTHGVLAELFFMIVLGITLLTSRSWNSKGSTSILSRSALAIVGTTWGLTFLQFVFGALTRHTDSWGVSNVFPAWSEEGFLPTADLWQYPQVVIHFVHRTTAYLVACMIIVQAVVLNKYRQNAILSTATILGVLLVVVQIALGAGIVWTARGELVTTLHVMVGVLLLVTNNIIMFTAFRAPVAHAQHESSHDILHAGGQS